MTELGGLELIVIFTSLSVFGGLVVLAAATLYGFLSMAAR